MFFSLLLLIPTGSTSMMMGVSINPCVYIDASVPEDLHSDLEASGQVPCRAVVGGETTGFIARMGKRKLRGVW
jgi:hypothetical protein